MKAKILLLLLLSTAFFGTLSAQQTGKYDEDILTIRKYDAMYAPPQHPIVFVGSSSIRKWDNLERTFGSFYAMNRGIGGAVVNEITYYLNDLVLKYKPRQIVIYVGENDLGDKTATPDSILNRTKRLIGAIRTALPTVPILYISIKPSPVREKMINTAIGANLLIKDYISTQSNIRFIDVFQLMLTPEGKSRPELFLSDMLHMNAEGYKIWKKAIEPYLLQPLAE